jgi:hypothetical protein
MWRSSPLDGSIRRPERSIRCFAGWQTRAGRAGLRSRRLSIRAGSYFALTKPDAAPRRRRRSVSRAGARRAAAQAVSAAGVDVRITLADPSLSSYRCDATRWPRWRRCSRPHGGSDAVGHRGGRYVVVPRLAGLLSYWHCRSDSAPPLGCGRRQHTTFWSEGRNDGRPCTRDSQAARRLVRTPLFTTRPQR